MRVVVVPCGLAALALILGGCGGYGHTPTSPSKTPTTTYDQAVALNEDPAGLGRQHILIADQFNNRVVEINAGGQIVWYFGLGPNDVSANSIVGVNDAERIGGDLTLMAGTGAPAGTEPLCPNGCADNRVILVDKGGRIVWQYGSFGVTGSGPDQLNTPVQATYLPNRHVLITDQANARIIEVTPRHEIVWQFGVTGDNALGPNLLNMPNSAELLENGHVLIADLNNNRAIEVTHTLPSKIVKTFTAHGTLNGVAFASRLPDGNTLITDSNNNRIVEVDAHDNIVWQYVTNAQTGSNPNPQPTRAVRLRNGTTLISDQFNDRVLIVDHEGRTLVQYGTLNVPGFNTQSVNTQLNAPYDAKVIGDFTGLTSPAGGPIY
jgi:outer membrane protein assembly factor BamB